MIGRGNPSFVSQATLTHHTNTWVWLTENTFPPTTKQFQNLQQQQQQHYKHIITKTALTITQQPQ
jgi:hypothetical protein